MDTDGQLVSIEPATGIVLWRGKVGDVDAACALARKAWSLWASEPLAKRTELLRRFVNEVLSVQHELAELIARETGKPLWEAQDEVEGVMAFVETAITAHAKRAGQQRMDGGDLKGATAIRHKPHGVVAVIGPFNFPAATPAGQIVPALLAGNVVIFKPSEKAPASGEMLLACMYRAGIPRDIVQLLVGGPAEGKALAAHQDVDGVLFTGSANTGIAINRMLASDPGKIVALEMGGNNPIVLWDTPKLSDAAALIVQSAFGMAGQRCTSARRLIVKDSMYDAAMAEIRKLTERMVIGGPLDKPQPFMGPVIDNDTADALTESFLYLLSNGGKAITHMRQPHDGMPFVTPGIIDVTAMAERPDIELFGPLLQVVRVADFDAAIAEANNTRYGLSASLIGGSPENYNRFWANIRAGIVNWNRTTFGAGGAMPFGGIGLSGNHRPGGSYAPDFSVYPVSSSEIDQPRASVGVGFRAR